LAKQASVTWEGFSRWWALVPIISLAAWGLMKANFQTYSILQDETKALRSELKEIQEIRAAELRNIVESTDSLLAAFHLSNRAPLNWSCPGFPLSARACFCQESSVTKALRS